MFQNLNDLFIVRCNYLGSFFASDVARSLFQLEYLYVGSCLFLERVVEVREEAVNKKKVILLPKLRSLSLEKLPVLYISESGFIDESPSLGDLFVKDCPQFSASASDFKSKNQVLLIDTLLNYASLMNRSCLHLLRRCLYQSRR